MPLPALHERFVRAIAKTAPAPPNCHCEEAQPTWQSREGSHGFADSFPTIQHGTARFRRRFAPLNDKHCANELMPQIMPACKAVTDRRYRRNCFNAAQYGSAVRCRARHASSRLVKKVPSGLFSPSCFPNCKIKFCSMILQFCRCGG